MSTSNGSALIKPRTAVVTIYTGDCLDRIRHLERQAEAAKDAADELPRIASEVPEYLDLAREHDALVAEAEESAIHLTVQALGRRESKALRAAHPPRVAGEDGVTERQARGDERIGVNEATFKEALVRGCEVEIDGQPVQIRSVVSPDLTDDDFDALADNDFDRIYLTAFALNWGAVGDPKASLVSRLTQKNDETSS